MVTSEDIATCDVLKHRASLEEKAARRNLY
jgi:hypothetical protein